jgi:hypothetical protein
MGVLSDLVVAPEADAAVVAGSMNPAAQFGGIDIKGISSVNFGVLHSILIGRPFKELLPQYKPLISLSSEGPWVFRIPQDLVVQLAGMSDHERHRVGDLWARTDEFLGAGWTQPEVAEAFESICALARNAVESKNALFLWMCV